MNENEEDGNNTIKNNESNSETPSEISKFKIINEYLNVEEDKELNQILNNYNKYAIIPKEDMDKIKIEFEKFLQISDEDLNKILYPYLKNLVSNFIEPLTDDKKKAFILHILMKEKEIKEKLSKFFNKISNDNLYGVPEKVLKTSFKDDKKFMGYFISKLSLWNANVEIILFYIEILEKLYDVKFEFDKKVFSFDKNFKSSFLLRGFFLRAASSIVSFFRTGKGIDYKKFLVFGLAVISTGFSPVSVALFPWQEVIGLTRCKVFNKLFVSLGNKIDDKRKTLEYKKVEDEINNLISNLDKIRENLFDIIKMEMEEETNRDLTQSRCFSINKTIADTIEKLKVYLRGVDFDYEIDKKVKKEFEIIDDILLTKEINDDWIYATFAIKKDTDNGGKNVDKVNEIKKKTK